MKSTIARGNEAELLVALEATKRGYIVSSPLNHSNEYDLIVDTGKLQRIQIKRAYEVNNHGSKALCVETRRILVKHSGKKGSVARAYTDNGYDYLIAVDCGNNRFWVIHKSITSKFKAQIYLGEKMKSFLEQWDVLEV